MVPPLPFKLPFAVFTWVATCFVAAVRSTGTWTASLPSLWAWATRPCAGSTWPGRWAVAQLLQLTLHRSSVQLWPLLSTEASQQVQEVLQGVWELDGKLEQLALHLRVPLSCFLHWNLLQCIGHVRLTVSVTVSTGPVQEPPSVPADGSQTGSSHHSFHASANERSELSNGWPLIVK